MYKISTWLLVVTIVLVSGSVWSVRGYVDLQDYGYYLNIQEAPDNLDQIKQQIRQWTVQPTFTTQSASIKPGFEYQKPDRFQPVSLEQAPEEVTYWVNEVLPYEQHRYADQYLVIPTMWAVMPVVEVPYGSADYEAMKHGREIDINKYLQNGILHFPHSADAGQEGKFFAFGHSNGLESRPGEFNAILANVMGLEAWVDQVWIFKKIAGKFQLFKYRVTNSYETDPGNVNVMKRDGQWADLAISACENILEGRWIIEWELIDEYELLWPRRARIDLAVRKISRLPRELKKLAVLYFFDKLEALEWAFAEDDRNALTIQYVMEELALVYPVE